MEKMEKMDIMIFKQKQKIYKNKQMITYKINHLINEP